MNIYCCCLQKYVNKLTKNQNIPRRKCEYFSSKYTHKKSKYTIYLQNILLFKYFSSNISLQNIPTKNQNIPKKSKLKVNKYADYEFNFINF